MFIRVNVALGAVLAALFVFASLTAPTFLHSAVNALFSPLLLIGLAAALLVIGGVRRIVLGPARKQKVQVHEGYATTSAYEKGADYEWICVECFRDFKDEMGWMET